MSEHIEIAVTSDASGATWTCCAWDAHAGTQLQPYRAGASTAAAANAIAYLNNRHIVAANAAKPLLHIWPVNGQEQVSGVRFVTPGRCTALDATPDGNFIVAGIAESVYVWQVCSGRLLAMLDRHFQPVTAVRCTADGSHFVTAGQDGMVYVWSMLTVIGGGTASKAGGNGSGANAQPDPVWSFADHAQAVTAVHVGRDGMRGLLVSVSLDRSARVYDLAGGELLLSVVFGEELTAVTLDHADATMFVGTKEGGVHQLSLATPPRQREYHISSTATSEAADPLQLQRFDGHRVGTAVTALSCSLDGESLLSGGADGNAHVWDIGSRKVMRTLEHKGAVLNAFFTLAPAVMFDAEQRLPLISRNLERMLKQDEHVVEVLVRPDGERVEWWVEEPQTVEEDLWQSALLAGGLAGSALEGLTGLAVATATKAAANETTLVKSNGAGVVVNEADEVERLKAEIRNLKQINKKLYKAQEQNVLKK